VLILVTLYPFVELYTVCVSFCHQVRNPKKMPQAVFTNRHCLETSVAFKGRTVSSPVECGQDCTLKTLVSELRSSLLPSLLEQIVCGYCAGEQRSVLIFTSEWQIFQQIAGDDTVSGTSTSES
jgi:hypothetical protein